MRPPLFRMGARMAGDAAGDGLPLRKRSPRARPAQSGAGWGHIRSTMPRLPWPASNALRAARFDIDDTAIRSGLGSVEWPGAAAAASHQGTAAGFAPARMRGLAGRPATTRIVASCSAVMAAEWAKEPAALPLYLVFAMQTTKGRVGIPAAAGALRHGGTRGAVPRGSCRLHAAGGLCPCGRCRAGLHARKRHRRGTRGPLGHPARADCAFSSAARSTLRARSSSVTAEPECDQTTVLIQLTSFCFGSAPILVAATWPFLNSSRVGIDRTP